MRSPGKLTPKKEEAPGGSGSGAGGARPFHNYENRGGESRHFTAADLWAHPTSPDQASMLGRMSPRTPPLHRSGYVDARLIRTRSG
jgi:hypothetical protein